MHDKNELKKTMYLFKQESNRLLHSDWMESPLPFKRFIDFVERDSITKDYLEDCVTNYLPEGFDAVEEVKTVSKDLNMVAGPFSTVPEEESAQVYLIIKELVVQNITGRSNFFYGFAQGSKKYEDMYKGFLDKVAFRLVNNISSFLTVKGIEMGLDDGGITNNFNAPIENTQLNQAAGGSFISAEQAINVDMGELNRLLDAVRTAANFELKDTELVEEVKDNVELVRAQIESGSPKRGLVKGALGFLKGVNGGAQFAAAIAQLIEFVGAHGISYPG